MSSEERLEILKMIESGTITAEEGQRLLEALEHSGGGEQARRPAKWLRIRVEDLATGRPKVNLNVPISLVNFALGMAKKYSPKDLPDFDMNELMEAIRSGGGGKLVDVEDEEDNVRVQITLE